MPKKKTELINEITFLHPVKMPLTEREIIAYADEFAALDTEVKSATTRHEAEVAGYKNQVKTINERQHKILDLLRVKEELKPVECIKEYDHFEQIAIIRRADNNEIVTTRKMTPDEVNRELPFSESIDDDEILDDNKGGGDE